VAHKTGNSGHFNPTTFKSSVFTLQSDISLPNLSYGSVPIWGDYNNDNFLDLLYPGSTIEIYKNNGNNTFSLQTDTNLPPDLYPKGLAWGDFNRDGYLDIFCAGYEATNIFINNGNNTFSLLEGTNLPGVHGVIALCDLDNDGCIDVILSGHIEDQIVTKVYRNNGDNSFTEHPGVNLKVVSGTINCLDLNNDGYNDIFMSGTNLPSVYINNGDFSFTEINDIGIVEISSGSSVWGDYDNDGDLDLIITGYNGRLGPLSKVYRNEGDYSFKEQSHISIPGIQNGSAVWGDYNNDGYLDIAIAGDEWYTPVTKIFLNNQEDNFIEQTNIKIEGVAYGFNVWADYDNDGDLDLLITSNSKTMLLRNDLYINNMPPAPPDGLQVATNGNITNFTWNPVKTDETPYQSITYNMRVGTTPGGQQIIADNSSEEGFYKLASFGNCQTDTFYILKNLLPGEYYWRVQAVDHLFTGGTFSDEMQFTVQEVQASNLEARLLPESTSGLMLKWKNGNGQRRVVFCKKGESELPVLTNNTNYIADSQLGYGDQLGETGWYCVYNGRADSTYVYGLAPGISYMFYVVEYNGSKGNELYYSTEGTKNPGLFSTGYFSEQTNISIPNGKLLWGDFNNDNFIDILTSGNENTALYINNGNNGFLEHPSISFPVTGIPFLIDYDNDGDMDIMVFNSQGLKIYKNEGLELFVALDYISIDVSHISSVSWGDYDNDGYIDFYIMGANGGFPDYIPISLVYKNEGNDKFTAQTNISLENIWSGAAAWGDFDNDGDLDLIISGSGINNSRLTKLYRNDGNDIFTQQGADVLPNLNIYLSSIAWGDYNNDGYLDLIISGNFPSTKVFKNNGDGTFSEQTDINITNFDYGSAAWGDYNNDGLLDILITGRSQDFNYITKIFKNNGDNTFSEQTDLFAEGVLNGSAVWADYDNDGDLDFFLYGQTHSYGIAKVFRNNSIMQAGNYNPNTKPSAPINLSSTTNPDFVKLSWNQVMDDETSFKSMSYNLRIAAIDGSSFCSAHSNALSGFRQISSIGNAQLNTFYLIKNLPVGSYHWQVQAIDQGYLGSEWSELATFEVKNTQAFFSATTVCHGQPTQFTDQSQATDGIVSWKWYFGDGGESTDQHPQHPFATSGTHSVKLVVASATDKDSIEVAVVVKPSPLVDFTAPTVCLGQETTLTNLTDTYELDIASWTWDYGDGKGSILQEPPPHGYINPGSYQVGLYVAATNGCAGSMVKTVSVGAIPSASLSANAPLSFCQGQSVTLEVPFNENHSYQWRDNGVNITGATSHSYIATRTGTFSAQVVNPVGQCHASSASTSVTVYDLPPKPTIAEATNTTNFCPGTPVTLQVTNPSQQYTYVWKRSGVEVVGVHQPSYSGPLAAGDYSVVAVDGICRSESSILTLTTKPTPAKPAIYARGPNVWILGCSNETATAYRWYHNDALIPGANTYTYVANQQLGNYFVRVNEGGECWTASDVINIPTGTIVGIDISLNPTEVAIFPNPSGGLFYVRLGEGLMGRVRVRVTNTLGQVVLAQEHSAPAFTLDLSSAPKGVYLCRIEVEGGSVVRRLVVE
jgi:PKD repeat protein